MSDMRKKKRIFFTIMVSIVGICFLFILFRGFGATSVEAYRSRWGKEIPADLHKQLGISSRKLGVSYTIFTPTEDEGFYFYQSFQYSKNIEMSSFANSVIRDLKAEGDAYPEITAEGYWKVYKREDGSRLVISNGPEEYRFFERRAHNIEGGIIVLWICAIVALAGGGYFWIKEEK